MVVQTVRREREIEKERGAEIETETEMTGKQ